jgi:hypothetical protein
MKYPVLVSTMLASALAVVAITALAQGDSAPTAPTQGDARLSVVHLAPFAAGPGTAVTVTLNATPVLTNFEFADSTGYLTVTAGTHLVEIFPAGSAVPAISDTVNFMADRDYTAIAIGDGGNQPLELLVLEDDNTPPPGGSPGSAKVRIGHLAPFARAITDTLADVRLQNDFIILDDVPYRTVSDYVVLPAGPYDLKITTADGSTTLIDPLPVIFNVNDILSVFAVGDAGNQPVGAFALPSGQPGYMLPLAPKLWLPFIVRNFTP